MEASTRDRHWLYIITASCYPSIAFVTMIVCPGIGERVATLIFKDLTSPRPIGSPASAPLRCLDDLIESDFAL